MSTIGLDVRERENLATLAAELSEAFTVGPLDIMSAEAILEETRVRIATPEGEVVFTDTAGANGGTSGQSLPPSAAWPLTKFSAFGGRANRGRMFLPGISIAAVNSAGAIEPSSSNGMSEAMGGFLSDLADADVVPVILHNDTELTPTVILGILCGSLVYDRGTRLRS